MSACRIVYVVEEEDDTIQRFGFAYGTLETHVERGEARYVVELHKNTGDVWFEIR